VVGAISVSVGATLEPPRREIYDDDAGIESAPGARSRGCSASNAQTHSCEPDLRPEYLVNPLLDLLLEPLLEIDADVA